MSGSNSVREWSASKPVGQAARVVLLWASMLTVALYFVPEPYNEIVLWPLRMFVTFIHESGHALATVISGGQVQYIQLHPNGSGVTWSAEPAWAMGLVFSAGYLGAALFGAMLLQVARLTSPKMTLTTIGVYILGITIFWANNPVDNLFTLVTGVTLACILFGASRFLSAPAAGFMVTFMAVQCCLSSVGDLRTLLYLTSAQPGSDNDAVFMSQHYPLPPTFWALLWAAIAVALLSASLWLYMRDTSGRRVGSGSLAAGK